MSREGFIKHVAIGAVAVVGGGALLRLTSLQPSAPSTKVASVAGYGDSAYGGVKQGGEQPTRRSA